MADEVQGEALPVNVVDLDASIAAAGLCANGLSKDLAS